MGRGCTVLDGQPPAEHSSSGSTGSCSNSSWKQTSCICSTTSYCSADTRTGLPQRQQVRPSCWLTARGHPSRLRDSMHRYPWRPRQGPRSPPVTRSRPQHALAAVIGPHLIRRLSSTRTCRTAPSTCARPSPNAAPRLCEDRCRSRSKNSVTGAPDPVWEKLVAAEAVDPDSRRSRSPRVVSLHVRGLASPAAFV